MNNTRIRIVLGGLLGLAAIAATGCGDNTRAPTSPTAQETPSGVASSMAGSDTSTSSIAGANRNKVQRRPFVGVMQLEPVGDPAFEPPATVSVQFATNGNVTQVGRFTGTLDVKIDVSQERTQTSRGSFTIVGSDGDRIVGTIDGQAKVVHDVTVVAETATITGGTGTFAHATGGFVIRRWFTETTLSPGAIEGSITY